MATLIVEADSSEASLSDCAPLVAASDGSFEVQAGVPGTILIGFKDMFLLTTVVRKIRWIDQNQVATTSSQRRGAPFIDVRSARSKAQKGSVSQPVGP